MNERGLEANEWEVNEWGLEADEWEVNERGLEMYVHGGRLSAVGGWWELLQVAEGRWMFVIAVKTIRMRVQKQFGLACRSSARGYAKAIRAVLKERHAVEQAMESQPLKVEQMMVSGLSREGRLRARKTGEVRP